MKNSFKKAAKPSDVSRKTPAPIRVQSPSSPSSLEPVGIPQEEPTNSGPVSLEDLSQAEARLANPVKRGRGRPPKNPPQATDGPGATEQAPAPVEIPVEVLAVGLQYPFKIAARARRHQGWELSDEKALEMAPLLDAVMKQYLPQLESRHAALISLCFALGAHSFQAFMSEPPREIPGDQAGPEAIEAENSAGNSGNGPSPISLG